VADDLAGEGYSQGRQRHVHPDGLTAHSDGEEWVGGAVEEESCRQPKDFIDIVARGRRSLNREPGCGAQHGN